MEEAKLLSEDCLPSIFALVSLLENVDEMNKVASGADVAFSFDEALMTSTMTSKGSSSDLGAAPEAAGIARVTKVSTTFISRTAGQFSQIYESAAFNFTLCHNSRKFNRASDACVY